MGTVALLRIEGIAGDSMAEGFQGWIDLVAWSFGATSEAIRDPTGGPVGGIVSVRDLAITKHLDRATPHLIVGCCAGRIFPAAELVLGSAGGEGLRPCFRLELGHVRIASVTDSATAADDRPAEAVGLGFTRFKVTYLPQNPDGSAGAPIGPMGWDIPANQQI
jgi:type VI secretion system secreted protein Hcp